MDFTQKTVQYGLFSSPKRHKKDILQRVFLFLHSSKIFAKLNILFRKLNILFRNANILPVIKIKKCALFKGNINNNSLLFHQIQRNLVLYFRSSLWGA